MTVNVSRFAYGLIVTVLAGVILLLGASAAPGAPLDGAWFVVPLQGALGLVLGFLKREGGIEDSGE